DRHRLDCRRPGRRPRRQAPAARRLPRGHRLHRHDRHRPPRCDVAALESGAVPGPEPFRIVAPRHEPVAPPESALPVRGADFDHVADVVVVGGGCAGLCSALFASWLGDDVVLLEKAPELGGTTFKSVFWTWVPDNGFMREAGIDDPEDGFLDYVA